MKTESIKSTTYPLSGIAYGMADNISLYICPNKTKALLVHYRKGSENIMVGIYVPLSMTDVPLTFCSESRIIDRELTAVKMVFLFIFFPSCVLLSSMYIDLGPVALCRTFEIQWKQNFIA